MEQLAQPLAVESALPRRLAAWVRGAAPAVHTRDLDSLRRLSLLAVFVGTALAVTGLVLGDAKLGARLPVWRHAWLLVDTLVLVPTYVALSALFAMRLAAALGAQRAHPALLYLLRTSAVSVLLTGAVDLVENLGMHLGPGWAWAATGKWILAGFTALFVACPAFCWFFELGVALPSDERRSLRRAVADIGWRTRYVAMMIVLFTALVLGLDQGRDVLVGVAQPLAALWPTSGSVDAKPHDAAISVLSLACSAIAVWTFSYVCWLWARVALRQPALGRGACVPCPAPASAGPTGAGAPGGRRSRTEQFAARWIARVLGVAPIFILVWLCGFAARDAVKAGALPIAQCLYWFAIVSSLLAYWLLWARQVGQHRDMSDYYQVTSSPGLYEELRDPHYRVLRWNNAPIWVPLFALVIFVLLRSLALFDLQSHGQPPVALAAVGFAMSFWTSLLAWTGCAAIRQQRPWVLLLVLGVGILGAAGLTENHVVWKGAWGFRRDDLDDAHAHLAAMLFAQAVLAFGVGLLLWTAFCSNTKSARPIVQRTLLLCSLALCTGSLLLGDRAIERKVQPPAVRVERPDLMQAMETWLAGLRDDDLARPQTDPNQRVPVYFVSAQGGGIRAAYWTAIVLEALDRDTRRPTFRSHTFSLSGVSGGAVGVAAWRACREPDLRTEGCADRLGSAALLTPLLAAWLMEDVVARVLPTSLCRAPGCNFLDRGAWFEASLEQAVPPMRHGLSRFAHPPHLFLNSTTVETGERSIASTVSITHDQFPTARDQLDWLDGDPSVAGAAHNSARFTYVNAIGGIRKTRCGDDDPDCRRQPLLSPISTRLADGGYFDNSGNVTTIDILHAFEQCVALGCGALTAQAGRELGKRLEPRVIVVRNGLPGEQAKSTAGTEPSGPKHCEAEGVQSMDSDVAWPRCAEPSRFYPDLLAPPRTAIKVGGTGVGERLAQARLEREVLRLRTRLEIPGALREGIECFDLQDGDTLYPLGWYLSSVARQSMKDQRAHYFEGSRPARCGPASSQATDRARRSGVPLADARPGQPGNTTLGRLAEREPGSGGLSPVW